MRYFEYVQFENMSSNTTSTTIRPTSFPIVTAPTRNENATGFSANIMLYIAMAILIVIFSISCMRLIGDTLLRKFLQKKGSENLPVCTNIDVQQTIDADVLSVDDVGCPPQFANNKRDNSHRINIPDYRNLPQAHLMSLAYTEDQIQRVLDGTDQSMYPVLVPHSRLQEIHSNSLLLFEMFRENVTVVESIDSVLSVTEITSTPVIESGHSIDIQDYNSITSSSLLRSSIIQPQPLDSDSTSAAEVSENGNLRLSLSLLYPRSRTGTVMRLSQTAEAATTNETIPNFRTNATITTSSSSRMTINPLHVTEYVVPRRSSIGVITDTNGNTAVTADPLIPVASVMSDEELLSEESNANYELIIQRSHASGSPEEGEVI